MRVRVYSYSFQKGGAAIAAKKFLALASKLYYTEGFSADNSCDSKLLIYGASYRSRYSLLIKRIISWLLLKLMRDGNPVKHSINIFSSSHLTNRLTNTDTETVDHIHWINNEAISIFYLGQLRPGSIITLHDEWLYCGTEHYYTVDKVNQLEFECGYDQKISRVKGVNLNNLIWKLKYKYLLDLDSVIVTAPSMWLLDRARRSKVLSNCEILYLPNPIDTSLFSPCSNEERQIYRSGLGLGDEDFVFAFGAVDGEGNPLKGGKHLRQAMRILYQNLLPQDRSRVKVLLFGSREIKNTNLFEGFSCINVGFLSSHSAMAMLYSASDCVIVPSLVEAFGQVAAESLSCGTPVVAFDTSGLKDIIQDGISGFLAKPYSAESLFRSLNTVMFLPKKDLSEMGAAGRKHIVGRFSYPVVTKMYDDILCKSLENKRGLPLI